MIKPDAHESSRQPSYHGVRFYESVNSLSQIVADFLGEGLAGGEPALVVAAPAQRAAIVRNLVTKGFDVVGLQQSGDLVMLDAEKTLSTFMTNGKPDGAKFEEEMCEVITGLCRGRANCTVRIYGQMVDVLWQNGEHEAAIRLETLWNQLAKSQAFSLMCGYALGNFYKDAHVDEIRSQHTHVISADGGTDAAA